MICTKNARNLRLYSMHYYQSIAYFNWIFQVHIIDDGVRQITEGKGVNVGRKSSSPDLTHYNEFVKLCKHVELLLEKSRAKLSSPTEEEKAATKQIQVDDDDFWHRSLKDANRNPSNPFDTNGFLASFSTTENHYVWRTTPILRYRSHFNPMRQHDLVRDDLAVRKLNNKAATAVAEKPARPNSLEDPISRKPPPHPNPPRKRPHSLPPNRRVAGHLRYHHRQSHQIEVAGLFYVAFLFK